MYYVFYSFDNSDQTIFDIHAYIYSKMGPEVQVTLTYEAVWLLLKDFRKIIRELSVLDIITTYINILFKTISTEIN